MLQESPSEKQSTQLTGLVHADLFLNHDTGSGHPESPARYTAVMNALRESEFADRLRWLQPRMAEQDELEGCHRSDYIHTAEHDIYDGAHYLSTGDTAVSAGSWQAALHAAGGACVAVDAVLRSELKNAFCVLRPPGHHATPTRGMGFCVFNNAAVAARYAQRRYGIGKVLILDWDVHHGNGTQDAFYDDDSVFFFSAHQWPWYPGTGARDETGTGRGLGTTMNCPLGAGSGRKQIMGVFERNLVPAVEKFKPELVIISAGFDSRDGDPLGGFHLSDQDFIDLTQLALDLGDQFAEGRVVSVLEGGYALDGLALAATAHCRTLVNHRPT
jgi:acetoin utilization deacetylase AcuC-like enzyme